MGTNVKAQKAYDIKWVTQSITRPANTTAYTAGDVMSDATDDAYFTFPNCLRAGNPSTGEIIQIQARTKSGSSSAPSLTLWFFSKAMATIVDNAALTYSDANLDFFLGTVSFAFSEFKQASSSSQVTTQLDVNLPIRTITPDSEIYCQAQVDNAFTPQSGEILELTLGIRLD